MVTLMISAALLLGWSAVAQAQFYTVHKTTIRARIAYEECNGECQLKYQTLNNRRFIRMMCEIPDEEQIPKGFIVATYIECTETPDVMIGVWDREGESPVCGDLSMGVIAAAFSEGETDRGKAEFLYGSEGLPIFATARGRWGPLPRRLEVETTCWSSFRTRSIAGALEENVVILDGEARSGSPIALYD